MHTSTNALIGVQCSRGKCRGRIRHGNKFVYTRWHSNPIDAAIARDTLAVSIYGKSEKTILNFPEPTLGT